jgi:hypothetical protein
MVWISDTNATFYFNIIIIILITKANDFSSSLCVQTSSEGNPASYPMGTRGVFSQSKVRQRCDADHSPLSSVEFKKDVFSWRLYGGSVAASLTYEHGDESQGSINVRNFTI